MNLDISTLGVVVGSTALFGGVALYAATSQIQRIALAGVSVGLLLFNGIGAAYPEMPFHYLTYYFGFILAFLLAFKFFTVAFLPIGRRVGNVLPLILERVDRNRGWRWIVPMYIALSLVPLVYPEFRLMQLFFPPAPDLVTLFAQRFQDQEVNILLKLVDYARMLLTPFFYVGLYRYRRRIWIAITVLITYVYIQYVDSAYVGRGIMAMTFGTIAVAVWIYRPEYRKFVVLATLSVLPVFLAFSYVWGLVRIGGKVGDVNFWHAVSIVVENQTNFPLISGIPIIESQKRVDLFEYFKWIFTLPIPKLLTGEIGGARVNYEISEIVLGIGEGMRGFFVILPGVVSESVYIYGKSFFWLHGVSLGALSALIVRLLDRTPQLLFLNGYVVMLLAYALSRGGISSVLPQLTNGFLLFYLYLLMVIYRRRLPRRPVSPYFKREGEILCS